jgi:hypothetical protein
VAAALALAVYAPLLAAAAAIVWRRPVLALYAFAVGLAFHNLAMALLYGAGVRGSALTAIAAWKEILLVVALAAAALPSLRERRLPFRPAAVDVLALAFALVVVAYALVPQDVLDGDAGAGAVAQAARYALTPVAAYLLGRALALGGAELARLALTIVATATFVAAFGLIEVYAVSLDWWRGSGAPGWFRDQLDLTYRGLSGLPENFVYNPGGERPLRRLVSTFLSPLATAYALVVALLVLAAWRRRSRLTLLVAALLLVALLYTHTRAALLALAVGLLALAALTRRWWPAPAAAAVLAFGAAFLAVYDDVAPRTSFTPAELQYQRSHARSAGDGDHGPLSPGEPSTASHWRNLRDGLETVARHPQGYGLGNAGTPARRFHERLRAGESTYTEIGVETGVLGLVLLVAWNLALLVELARRRDVAVATGLAAALVAILALAVETDVLAVPWLTYCLWSLAGAVVTPAAWPARAAALARPDTVEA